MDNSGVTVLEMTLAVLGSGVDSDGRNKIEKRGGGVNHAPLLQHTSLLMALLRCGPPVWSLCVWTSWASSCNVVAEDAQTSLLQPCWIRKGSK